ncbi:MAG TPA: contact-dependent growth inhibition system immunity protein [Gammaproteobacteria bacterium]|nr:contact-dependent growth inhibition system immunity protein [Gammaproteobacteria bacterium]
MKDKSFPALSNLLGSYFHQDWVVEFPDDERVLAAIQESEPREQIAEACSEISSIVASNRSDASVSELLHGDLGCYFEPNSRDMTSKEWLEFVGRRLAGK